MTNIKSKIRRVSIRLKLYIIMALAVILLASNLLLFYVYHYQINQLNGQTQQIEKVMPKLTETLYIKKQFEKSISRADSQRVVDSIDNLEKDINILKKSFAENDIISSDLNEIDNYVEDFRKSVNMSIQTKTQEKNYDKSMQESLHILLELIDSSKNNISDRLLTKISDSDSTNAAITSYEYLTKLTGILISNDLNNEEKLVEQLDIANKLVDPMIALNLRDKGLQISYYSQQLHSKWRVLQTARDFEDNTDIKLSSIIDKIDINVETVVKNISQTLKAKDAVRSAIIITLFICSTIGFFLLAFVSARRINYKLKVLIGATEQIAGGDFSVNIIPKDGDEMDLLGRYIYTMSKKLESYQKSLLETNVSLEIANANLEDAVLERTHELEETRDKLIIVNDKLERDKKKFQLLATTDSLTSVWNRGAIMGLIKDEINQYTSNQRSFCVVLFDIDDFKKVNDVHGHAVGDEVLIEITKLAKKTIRDMDCLGRYGGEEFLVLLPNTTLEIAKTVVEDILDNLRITNLSSKLLPIRISAGLVEYKNATIDELLQRADELLYKSKRNGKDQFNW